jgi:pterin-4a-carbinolamine dehydratase
MSQEWKERKRPLRLETRYEFSDYEQLRDFLDQAADLSERLDFYPDMGFGRDYVNITIHTDEDQPIQAVHRQFASELDELHNSMPTGQD